MRAFTNKEVQFEVPEDWQDRTVISFEIPKEPGKPVGQSVTLMRVPASYSRSLQAFASQQIAALSSGLDKFEIVRQANTQVGELPAVEILFHWQHPEGPVTQRITMFVRDTTVWTFTATTNRGEMDSFLPTFDRVLRSLVVHPPAGETSPSTRDVTRNW